MSAITAIRPKPLHPKRLGPNSLAKAPTRRAADLMVATLVQQGVRRVLALPGGTISPILDAFVDRPEVEVVVCRHEGDAMFAAAGLARATHELAVVCVTSGPGILNALTGIANAKCEGLPLLVLAGEVPRPLHGRQVLQEGSAHHLDVLHMARPITKLAAEVTRPDGATALLRRAIQTATSGRQGPVLLTVPLDVSLASAREMDLVASVTVDFGAERASVSAGMSRAASAIDSAERVAILAGSGVRHGNGQRELARLATKLQIPVMTTPKAKGLFPESDPLSLGVFGHGGHPSAHEYLEGGLDALIAVGTSLSDPGTDGWSPLLEPREALVHIDVDAAQIGRHYATTHGLVGPADVMLRSLARRLRARPRLCRYGVRHHCDPTKHAIGDEGLITPQRALWELQRVVARDTFYTCDIGEHLLFATHYLVVDPPAEIALMNGLASMGSGLGAALGVQLADRDRSVVAICGDGVFAMMSGVIATAAAYELPLVVLVLNDQRFGMVELGHKALYGRTPTFSTGPLSVASLARALGADGHVVRHPGEIAAMDLAAQRGPVVLDVHIDRSVRMPKNARFDELKQNVAQPPLPRESQAAL